MSTSSLRKATAVMIVEVIEPVMAFWQKLGLQATVQVPDATAGDGRIGFVILAAAGFEIMYQTVASVRADLGGAASDKTAIPTYPQTSLLFVDVDDLTVIEQQLQKERQVMPLRTTFYGTTELGYADPAGNIIVFAQASQSE